MNPPYHIPAIQHDHKVMHYLLGKYRQLEDTQAETAKMLESQTEMIRVMDESLRQTRKMLESQKALTESINGKLSQTVEKVERRSDEIQSVADNLTRSDEKLTVELMKITANVKSNFDDIEKLKIEANGNKTAVSAFQTFKEERKIICEAHSDVVRCSSGTVNIRFANYGRLSVYECFRPELNTVGILTSGLCVKDVTSRAKSLCQGHQECRLSANNAAFGDPCGGTYKYLEVIYKC